MRRLPLIRSIVATLFGLSAAVVGVTVAANPAAAAGPCCDVRLSGFPTQFHAGAGAEQFQVSVTNTSNNPIGGVTVTLSFKGTSLNRNQVHLEYKRNGGWRGVGTTDRDGMIVAESSPSSGLFKHSTINPGKSVDFPYRLSFGGKVPSQSLSVWLTVTPGWRGGQAAQAGPYSSSIVGVGAVSTPTTNPTPTPIPSESDTSAATTPDASSSDDLGAGVAPTELSGSDGSGGGSGLAWLAYTIGALLLVGGIGVIGTMLWRRGPQPVETNWAEPEPYQPQHASYPTATYQSGGYDPYQADPYQADPYQADPYQAPAQPAPYQADPYQADPYQAPAQPAPTGYGTPTPPTTRYHTPQDPYADETRLDLR